MLAERLSFPISEQDERIQTLCTSEHFIPFNKVNTELTHLLSTSRYLSLGLFSFAETSLAPVSKLPAPELLVVNSAHLKLVQTELTRFNHSPVTFAWLTHLRTPVEYQKGFTNNQPQSTQLAPGWYLSVLNATHHSEISWGLIPLPGGSVPDGLINNQESSLRIYLHPSVVATSTTPSPPIEAGAFSAKRKVILFFSTGRFKRRSVRA